MSKRNKFIYWISTIWLALGMLSTAVVQLIRMPSEIDNISQLGYPPYLLTILGTWKILGVITILMPKLPLLKEWAYAGFFFAMSGAMISRVASGDAIIGFLPSLLLLVLTIVSWYFRPADKRITNQIIYT